MSHSPMRESSRENSSESVTEVNPSNTSGSRLSLSDVAVKQNELPKTKVSPKLNDATVNLVSSDDDGKDFIAKKTPPSDEVPRIRRSTRLAVKHTPPASPVRTRSRVKSIETRTEVIPSKTKDKRLSFTDVAAKQNETPKTKVSPKANAATLNSLSSDDDDKDFVAKKTPPSEDVPRTRRSTRLAVKNTPPPSPVRARSRVKSIETITEVIPSNTKDKRLSFTDVAAKQNETPKTKVSPKPNVATSNGLSSDDDDKDFVGKKTPPSDDVPRTRRSTRLAVKNTPPPSPVRTRSRVKSIEPRAEVNPSNTSGSRLSFSDDAVKQAETPKSAISPQHSDAVVNLVSSDDDDNDVVAKKTPPSDAIPSTRRSTQFVVKYTPPPTPVRKSSRENSSEPATEVNPSNASGSRLSLSDVAVKQNETPMTKVSPKPNSATLNGLSSDDDDNDVVAKKTPPSDEVPRTRRSIQLAAKNTPQPSPVRTKSRVTSVEPQTEVNPSNTSGSRRSLSDVAVEKAETPKSAISPHHSDAIVNLVSSDDDDNDVVAKKTPPSDAVPRTRRSTQLAAKNTPSPSLVRKRSRITSAEPQTESDSSNTGDSRLSLNDDAVKQSETPKSTKSPKLNDAIVNLVSLDDDDNDFVAKKTPSSDQVPPTRRSTQLAVKNTPPPSPIKENTVELGAKVNPSNTKDKRLSFTDVAVNQNETPKTKISPKPNAAKQNETAKLKDVAVNLVSSDGDKDVVAKKTPPSDKVSRILVSSQIAVDQISSLSSIVEKSKEKTLNPEKYSIENASLFFKNRGKKSAAMLKSLCDSYSSLNSLKISHSNSLGSDLIVKESDNELIWQQVSLQNKNVFKEIKKTLKLYGDELKVFEENIDDASEDEYESDEDMEVDGGDDEEEPVKKKKTVDLFNLRESDLKNLDAKLNALDEDDDDEEEEDNIDDEEEEEVNVVKTKKSAVDDKFFKLSDMEKFIDGKDVTDFTEFDDDDEDFETDYRYADFFEESGHKKKPAKKVQFQDAPMEDEELDEGVEDEDEESSEDEKDDAPVLMGPTRTRDKPTSSHEASRQKMFQLIDKIQAENLNPRSWELSGEIKADDREVNGLLEKYVEADFRKKQPPINSKEKSDKIHSICLRRFKDKLFDDVARKYRDDDSIEPYRNLVADVNDRKSLMDVYEEKFQATQNDGRDSGDEIDPQEKNVQKHMNELFHKLDALSHLQFAPSRISEEIRMVKNMPSMRAEEVGPMASAAADETLLAPEEISRHIKKAPKSKDERTLTDKNQERRKKKKKQHVMANRDPQSEEKKKKPDLQSDEKKKKPVLQNKEKKKSNLKK